MLVTPYNTGEEKKQQVRTMFNQVAHKYDFLNRLLSFGIDKSWRKKTIGELAKENPKLILDVATGTADLAIAASKINPDKIIGVDISENMLQLGREKVTAKNLDATIELMQADSENLPFATNYFEAVMVSFGVRNFQDLKKGLKEMNRVLKPEGKVLILEFSKPSKFPIKQLYLFYSKYILPVVGKSISGDDAAYKYLPESVKYFPSGNEFGDILLQCGFNKITIMPFTFGIVTLYTAFK